MPERKVTRETVLEAALSLVREQGEGALSARAIADRAGCSVQPIYSLFGDMKSLVKALYDHARVWVAAYNREHEHRATERVCGKRAFPFALGAHRRQPVPVPVPDRAHGCCQLRGRVPQRCAANVERCVEELSGLDPVAARALYLHMIVYTHGMATMLASGARFDDEELHERLDEAFRGLSSLAGGERVLAAASNKKGSTL